MNLENRIIYSNYNNITEILYQKFVYLIVSRGVPAVSFDYYVKHSYSLINLLINLKLPFVLITNYKSSDILDKIYWCEDVFDDAFIWTQDQIFFEKEEQVTLFHLRWGGK